MCQLPHCMRWAQFSLLSWLAGMAQLYATWFANRIESWIRHNSELAMQVECALQLGQQGHWGPAEQALAGALPLVEKALGASHPCVARALCCQAQMLRQQYLLEEASSEFVCFRVIANVGHVLCARKQPSTTSVAHVAVHMLCSCKWSENLGTDNAVKESYALKHAAAYAPCGIKGSPAQASFKSSSTLLPGDRSKHVV